jgi:DNA uptake protein ComE-like DNA-binding protein
MRPYALPEVLHADNFRQSVYVPRKTNVNTAPLAELMSLPGIDMNIALKLIRVRPVSSLEDIERKMPTLTPSSIQQLIQYLDPKVLIK